MTDTQKNDLRILRKIFFRKRKTNTSHQQFLKSYLKRKRIPKGFKIEVDLDLDAPQDNKEIFEDILS